MTSSSATTEAPGVFVCDSGDSERSACKSLPFFKEHEGKRYCVLHYPGKEKVAVFAAALRSKLEAGDFNFCGAWFPAAAEFDATAFTKDANFNYATFSAKANFRYARFGWTLFSYATFIGDANFYHSTFEGFTDFSSATFQGEANFRYAAFFGEVKFRHATFKGRVWFSGDAEREVFGDKAFLNFQFARIERPELFSFHTVTPRPHWFVNVDARKFEFVNVDWDWPGVNIKEEIKHLKRRNGPNSYRLLAIACRNLALNAEENHRYEEASRFRYMAMDVRRPRWRLRGKFFDAHGKALKRILTRSATSLRRDWGVRGRARTRLQRFLALYWKGFDLLHWLYWLASGYGERVLRAFTVLVVLWLLFAGAYTTVGFAQSASKPTSESDVAAAKRQEAGKPLCWRHALTYSLGVMTLQKPEPRPATNAAQSLVMLETILGPVQAALLALAIRRKFMR